VAAVVLAPVTSSILNPAFGQSMRIISCQDVVEFCLDFLDGALPEEERGRFTRHLSVCSDCVTFFETYRRTPEVSRQAMAMEMPAQVKEAVRSYLRSRCQK
jgi:anti-sigma factor RsiW